MLARTVGSSTRRRGCEFQAHHLEPAADGEPRHPSLCQREAWARRHSEPPKQRLATPGLTHLEFVVLDAEARPDVAQDASATCSACHSATGDDTSHVYGAEYYVRPAVLNDC